MKKTPIPRPDRLRRIAGSFGWVDHRLLRNGHLAWLEPVEMALYLFLVLAADRNGVSYYRLEKISRHLGFLDWGELFGARRRLIELELIGFAPFSGQDRDGFYQVLSLDGLAPRESLDGR